MKSGRVLIFALVALSWDIHSLLAADIDKKDGPDGNCLSVGCLADAAEADLGYVKNEDLPTFAGNLARAGRFTAARAASARIKISSQEAMRDSENRQNAEQAIAIDEFAAETWANPTQVASYAGPDALAASSGKPPDSTNASNYWLLAEQILNRIDPTGVSPDLEKLLRLKVLRHGPNASLDNLLQVRWPQTIEKEPTEKQGWYWNYVAQVYTEMGDSGTASKELDRAEQCGAYDFQGKNQVYVSTTWGWLRLGNFDRALKAARQVDPKATEALLEVKIAEALLASGRKEQAYRVLREAESNSANESRTDQRMQLLGDIVDGYLDAGNAEDAKRLTDKVLDLARLPGLFPAAQLAVAAKAYNDIGDHAHATDLLHEAAGKLAAPHKTSGNGAMFGLISGSIPALEVIESIRSSIAIESYRADDRKDFSEQFGSLAPDYQTETWLNLYADSRSRHEASPSVDEVLSALPPESQIRFLSDAAGDAIASGKPEEARALLQMAIDKFTDVQSPQTLLYLVKVAYTGGLSDLVIEALHKAASAAQKIDDKGKRATELAAVAASEHELLNQ